MAETLTERIDRLQALLDAGTSSTSIEGQSFTFDLPTVRRQLLAARAELAASQGTPPRRPFASRIVLGHE